MPLLARRQALGLRRLAPETAAGKGVSVGSGRRRRAAPLGLLIALVLVAAGCGSDHPASTTSPRLISVAEFAKQIERPQVVTINVHTPNAGNIAGTDLAIPFEQIAASTELPKDHHAPLAVYCRSGNMSAIAVATLHDLGYTDIVELSGGYDAWLQSGRTLQPT